jgi:hypothetical protein
MPSIEVEVSARASQELTAVRVGSGIGHREDAGAIVPQIRVKLVVELKPVRRGLDQRVAT